MRVTACLLRDVFISTIVSRLSRAALVESEGCDVMRLVRGGVDDDCAVSSARA